MSDGQSAMPMKLEKYPPDPEIKRRWFNVRWFFTFNLPLTLILTPLAALYQYGLHGGELLSDLHVRAWIESAVIAFIPVIAAYYLIGDGWVYYRTRRKLRDQGK
jgi:hypothetical protein